MGYILKGQLLGSICGSCQEALANIKVRLYRPADPTTVTAAAVASPKETFAVLAETVLGKRQKLLIAETTTDGDGNYLFRLGEDYDGGPVEFDIYVEKVPNQQPSKQTFAPVQAVITTVQPAWRQGDGDKYAVWNNTLSAKQWCGIRRRFDAWTICGRVVACDTKAPLAGMTVRAFDGDWLGDDWLGSAVTDGAGRFRIDYTGAAFRKFLGPFNVTGSGPDLYFKVFDPSMTLLPPLEGYARAHMPDRDDASNCFCVELCVNFVAPLVTPWFTSVGDFDIYADINSSGDGKINKAVLGSSSVVHGGAGFAFYGDLTLVGQVPAKVGSQLMKYRFLFASPSGSSTLVPITGSYLFPVQVEETQPIIGWDFHDGHGPRNSVSGPFPAPKRKVFVAASVGDVTTLTNNPASTDWTLPAGPPPPGPNPLPDLVLIPDAQGWVNVPDVLLAGLLGNKLIGFRSYASGAVPGGGPVPVPTGWSYDVPGGWAPVAGDNVVSLTSPTGAGNAPAVARNGGKIDLYFQAQPVGAPSPTYSQGPLSIYVNNWSSVVLLDITEFHGAAANDCSPITSSLDIQYTADHELMRAWSIQIVTAATLPPLTPPLPGGSTPRGGHGTLTYNTGGSPAWQNCSYVVYLNTQRALTNGYIPDDGNSYTWLSFCKE